MIKDFFPDIFPIMTLLKLFGIICIAVLANYLMDKCSDIDNDGDDLFYN